MTSVVITQIMNGITIGLIFALIAIGLTIVMGLMGVVNFAHGSFYMIGGYMTFFISSTMGHFWLGLLIGGLTSAGAGLVLFYAIIRPLKRRPPLEPLVALVGVAMILRQLIMSIWGAAPKLLPIPLGRIQLNIFGLSITYPTYFLVVIIIAVALLISLYFLFKGRCGDQMPGSDSGTGYRHVFGSQCGPDQQFNVRHRYGDCRGGRGVGGADFFGLSHHGY